MGKMKSNWKWYLGAFGLPFIISLFICIRNGVYPFGENCILHIDMYHQYEPFFTEFMDKLKHGGSLMYSFRLGLGSDFVSLIAYYLASPLNWFIILCPSSHVIEFMTLLILLKIGLCGLTFAVYLKNHFGKTNAESIVFAAFYALSGYMAAYSWDIMWLDVLVLAPLAVLGLEYLVKEGKCRLYCITLAAAVLANFYIAYMLCIFLIFWFFLLFFEETHSIKQKAAALGRFTLYSLLAGGMGAVLIFPEAAILGYSGSAGISFPSQPEWYFDLISMLARHCFGVKVYTGRDHWPNLYCGLAVGLFFMLYLQNRMISWKKKIKRAALVVFFWLGFANNILDFIWHGLHFPDSLPGRWSYLYIFLLLVTAYESFLNLKGNKWRDVVIGIFVSFAFLIAAALVTDSGMVTGTSLALTGCLVAGYGMLLLLWLIANADKRIFVRYMMLVLAVTELYANTDLTGFSTTSRTSYTKNWESVKSLLAQVDETDEELFYRVEEMERLTKNDAMIYGYSSSTIFSSLMNIGVSRFYRNMGMEGGKNFYSCSGATPLMSALLSVKYVIADHPCEESPLRILAAEDGQNYIYRNLYSMPLGFMMDVDFESRCLIQKGEPVANINRMAKTLGANADLLQPFGGRVDVKEDKTEITASKDCYLYATYTDTSVTNITAASQERTRKFTKCDHGYILDLGWCKAGEKIELTNTSNVSDFQVSVYGLNMEALQEAYEKLGEQTMVLDGFSDTVMEGHIQVKNAGNLVLSIPKEDGWRVFVDGKEIECKTFMDSLMKIPLIRGNHKITLRYTTPGLINGAAVSLCSLFFFIAICIWKRKRN